MASADPPPADLKERLTQAGLDADYWIDILESKLKVTLPQQIQYLKETHLIKLEGSIRQDWEKEALKNLLGIQNEQPLSNEGKEGDTSIISKVNETGLDGVYWANVLKSKLGVTEYDQIAHLNLEDFEKLKGDIRNEREESALTKLFCLHDTASEQSLMTLQIKHKEQQKEIQNLLREVSAMRKAGVERSNDKMSSKLELLSQVMSIPKNQWTENYDDKSFDDMIDKMSSEIEGIIEREPIKSMAEILNIASGGLALRGVLVGEDFGDERIKRVVLNTPTDIVHMNPVMQQVDDETSFSSKTQSDHFHQTLDNMGYSAAASLEGGGWGLKIEGKYSREKEEEHEVKSERHKHIHFESRVQYTFVPIASCELNPSILSLSKEALHELKIIDKVLVGGANRELVEKKCRDFLSAFGSHINAGVLHFGGVYKFVATYVSKTISETDEVKSMVRDVLSYYASAGHSGLRFGIGGSVSADQLTTHTSATNIYEKSELAKTNLQTHRKGGPPEVSSLALWKIGLVSCNSTWALIDRGKSLSQDFVGLWKLISNHGGEFQKLHELESTLESVWEKMSGYSGSSHLERNFMQGVNVIDQLIEKIGKWNSHDISHQQCLGYLQEIQKAISEAEVQTSTSTYWMEKLCTEERITSFLEKIVALRDQFSPRDSSEIRLLLRKLVKPVGFRKFSGREEIMKFAEVNPNEPSIDVPSILDISSINSIYDLIANLKKIFTPALQLEHERNDDMNERALNTFNAAATRDVALCVGQILRNLQSSKETHEKFFLEVALLSLDYRGPKETFGTLITMKKLETFTKSIEESWKEFQVHKEEGPVQMEGFLIHQLLTTSHFSEGQHQSEEEFSEFIKELRQVISYEVNMVLNKYSAHSPFNWIDMRADAAELAKGNISIIKEREVNITALEKVASCENKHTETSEPSRTADRGIAPHGDFQDILDILGLSKYYPSKISVSDAIAIKNKIEDPKLVDIPWMILNKLFKIDFRSRDQPFSDVNKSSKQNESQVGDEFGFEEALLQLEIDGDVEEEPVCVSTLDALVALFACCDNFLKQVIAQKLFVCKLAIPFLYPLGSNVGGEICMSLWALRTIIVQCQGENKDPSETPVTNGAFPLVTFMRLGRVPLSKSRLLNNVLRDDSHDTFFHVDCDNGVVPRRITDGLVECSWFIPKSKEIEHLPGTTMFLNLRGDASLMKKQLQILQKISSVMFVLVSAKDLAKPRCAETCQQLLQADAKVILLLVTSSGKGGVWELRDCHNAVGKDLLRGVPIMLSNTKDGNQKNASELKTETRSKISKALSECSGVWLEDCAKSAREAGIVVDEYEDKSCIEGKEFAEKTFSHIKGEKIEKCRDILLPLQGTEWIGYSKHLKNQHKANKKGSQASSANQPDTVQRKMKRSRENQVETCVNGLSPFVTDFISGLQRKHQVVMYFLKWMSLFLDEKSISTLPGIRREYYHSWNKFQLAQKDGDKENLQKFKVEVAYAEQTLAKASLGLENLFREMGQVYEALEEGAKIGKETKLGVENLVEIAATLLLKGIPLELVDGDAANIPIKWVSAVLNKVENRIGKKRFYVISVLGIQSSGKSTLLNTMFGLQFAVSAGRCTRGAYMQLVPVDEEAGLPFHYVVVVDTEGLRAPELGQQKFEHDNELATLVIGLGDVTLINVKGENTAEIKDTLQIAVHAFLRMNLVKRHIRDNRTCMFIHQNVPAANADELMRHGCQKLKESLDERAREAAFSENIADIHSFSQIINFDIEKHVWYISDLWHGNPPMAPANPGYSEKINEVKRNLLGNIAEGKTFLSASELSIRITDLWNGVLADDFVFSFRNSLEVKAYNSLQSEYYTLESELQKACHAWSYKAEITLKRCEGIKILESSYRTLLANLPKVLSTKADDIRARLETYFETSDLKEIISQWQQPKLKQLQFAYEDQEREGRKDLLSVKEAHRVEILHAQNYPKHESYMMKKAVELADKLKGKEASDDELEEMFDYMWVSMVNELTPETDEKELQVDCEMQEILEHKFHYHQSLLQDELNRNPLSEQTSFETSVTEDFVEKGHISIKVNFFKKGLRWLSGSGAPEEDAKHKTVRLTESILREINTDLRRLPKDMKFQKYQATQIIEKLVLRIHDYNQRALTSKEHSFTILPKYVVKLAVHVSQYCVQVFTSKQVEYYKKHGVKSKLQAYRAKAWSLFKNKVKDAKEEVLAGDVLCTHLKEIVKKTVTKASPRICVDEILRDLQRSKYHLLQRIMVDLAVNANFKNYSSFIIDAKEFALRWLTRYTNEKMFSLPNASGISRYAEIAKSHIGIIMQCITQSVSHATSKIEGKKGEKMAQWIEGFCDRVSEQIAVRVGDLSVVSERSVMNFNNLQRVVFDQLDIVQTDLENMFANTSPNSVDWDGPPLPQQVLDKIWGCTEQCPFCHEPCADTTLNHVELSGKAHWCVQHRPIGLAGVRWTNDGVTDSVEHEKDELSHFCCNYNVQLERVSFRCGVCQYKCQDSGKCSATDTEEVYHKYVEYNTFLPEWDIAPDRTNSVSKYWTWVMATYQHQLKDWHKAKLPNIPDRWASVTKEEALEDLRKIHH